MKNPPMVLLRVLAVIGALLLLAAPRVQACATCFGASDSDMAKGMNMGIFSLLVVVVGVLGCLAAFFVFLARRSGLTPMPQGPVAGGDATSKRIDE